MYQQYMNQVQLSLSDMSSDELKELLNNDDELEKRVDEVVSCNFLPDSFLFGMIDDSFNFFLSS